MDGKTVNVRYFLFPVKKPAHQGHAVAQVICQTKLGAQAGNFKVWVDALRENELSYENIQHIKLAL